MLPDDMDYARSMYSSERLWGCGVHVLESDGGYDYALARHHSRAYTVFGGCCYMSGVVFAS